MRDMCEDLKGLYFVIMGNRLREKLIYNNEIVILSSRLMYKRECSLFMRIQLGAIRIQSVVSRELE
jgi:hypothetical protein